VTLGTAAQVISFFSVAYGISQLLFGPLGDRFGKYRVIAWATVACALGSAACALAVDFRALLAARVLAGAMAAAIIPLAMAWIGDVVEYRHRQPVLARFLIGQIVGLAGGVWFGGFTADRLSWRAPYVVIGALLLAVGALLFALQRRLPARARQAAPPAAGSAPARIAADFAHVLAQPWARTVLVVVFLEGALLYGPFAFFASHLHARFGVALSLAGALVMLYGLGGLLFAATAGRLVPLLGETGLARWGGAVLFAGMLAVAFAPAWWWAAPGCLAAGMGFYMLHNTLQINATQMAPQRRGAAVAAFAGAFFLGQSAGVTLVAAAAERIGTGNAIALGACGVLALAQLFARQRARHG
jgi:predicted MFS family arabinose efflux permease